MRIIPAYFTWSNITLRRGVSQTIIRIIQEVRISEVKLSGLHCMLPMFYTGKNFLWPMRPLGGNFYSPEDCSIGHLAESFSKHYHRFACVTFCCIWKLSFSSRLVFQAVWTFLLLTLREKVFLWHWRTSHYHLAGRRTKTLIFQQ